MNWKSFLVSFGLFCLTMVSPSTAFAECGGMCSWGGMMGTGGSNLYGFGSNLFDVTSMLGGGLSGGGCGLMSSCGSSFGSAGLFGNNWGLGGGGSSSFDIDLGLLILPDGGGNSCSSCCSSCGGGGGSDLSSLALLSSLFDPGCSIGMCSGSGMMPYTNQGLLGTMLNPLAAAMLNPMSPLNPLSRLLNPLGNSMLNPIMNPYPYGLLNPPGGSFVPPGSSFPNPMINPFPGTVLPDGTVVGRPPVIPYGGCDGVIVLCPTSTVIGAPGSPHRWRDCFKSDRLGRDDRAPEWRDLAALGNDAARGQLCAPRRHTYGNCFATGNSSSAGGTAYSDRNSSGNAGPNLPDRSGGASRGLF